MGTSQQLYNPQEVYRNAINRIRKFFDLELSLIEKAILRNLVAPVLSSLDCSEENSYGTYFPDSEVVTRFMYEYYDLSPELASLHAYIPKSCKLYIDNPDQFLYYLKIIQEKKHLP